MIKMKMKMRREREGEERKEEDNDEWWSSIGEWAHELGESLRKSLASTCKVSSASEIED